MNETLLRSIVTQPSSENYVYAYNFTALAQARNLVVGSTCQTYVPELTTTTTTTTTTTDADRQGSRTIPSFTTRPFNGKVQWQDCPRGNPPMLNVYSVALYFLLTRGTGQAIFEVQQLTANGIAHALQYIRKTCRRLFALHWFKWFYKLHIRII